MAHEPLLPAEKKLIAGSLILGILLLGLLLWVTARFFPIGAIQSTARPGSSAPASSSARAPGRA
jgi:hypothetical protein